MIKAKVSESLARWEVQIKMFQRSELLKCSFQMTQSNISDFITSIQEKINKHYVDKICLVTFGNEEKENVKK